MTVKQKFDKIDQSKLLQAQVDILKSMQAKTDNFKTKDKEALEKIEMGLDKIIAKLKESNPDALKSTARKTSTAGKAKAKTTSASTTGGKNNVMALAKKIRKPNESWPEAQKRAKASLQGDIKQASKVVTSELQKLKAFINRRKQLKGIAGTDLLRDATRKAKPRGSRKSKEGNVYYEYRENRTDRLAPNYPKNAPLLAGGGGVDGIEENIDMTDDYVLRVNKGVEPKDRASMREFIAKTNESREAMTYELGGAFMQTDLAGNTGGGTGGLNAKMALSGVSGTHYTGLVGETGALSSGEMFAGGGALSKEDNYKRRLKFISEDVKRIFKNSPEKYLKTPVKGYENIETLLSNIEIASDYTDNESDNWSFARGGGVRKVGNRVYSLGRNWTNDHKHTNKSEKHEVAYSRKGMFATGGAVMANQQVIDDASQHYVNYYLNEGASAGMFKDGGAIKNQYDGRTPEDIWNNLSRGQRSHFLYDHMDEIQEYKDFRISPSQIRVAINSDWYSLDKDIKNRFSNHVREGQYATGGMMPKPSTSKHRND